MSKPHTPLGRLAMQRPGPGFDCAPLLSRCKAECCGSCPIPAFTWQTRQADLQQPPVYAQPDGTGGVLQHAANGDCCFKRSDCSCAIYPQPGEADPRDSVCALFGGESHAALTCPWQDRNGRPRARGERRALKQWIRGRTDEYLAGLRSRAGSERG